ncbi:MAG: 3-phosphoshikimate 1-carboxyvinyltransferase [Actinobacteria bacterium]|nr:3-phosphoshikimate 1-carboxyvinyltransferase [Actinomycetota bacterium]
MNAPAGPTRTIRLARPGLDARVRVPGSKSVTNRALLLAALASGESVLRGALEAGDTEAFAAGLRSLGVAVERLDSGLLVRGAGGPFPADEATVYCDEAGTAARFLLAASAAGRGAYHFDAAPQLRRRPLGQLLDALRAQGVRTEPAAASGLPLTLAASGLAGGGLRLPGDTSSQFVSALLMAAPLGRAALELDVDGLVSRPYVTMTLRMMEQFGVTPQSGPGDRFVVVPGRYLGREYDVEPDASTASYFFAAAAVAGRVRVAGLHRRHALQGDVAFLDVLAAMGCLVEDLPEGVRVTGPAALSGLTVDMTDIPDTFMTLAAIAPLATSPVTVTGIGTVRLKESDRIAAVEENLGRTGVKTESGPDWLRVYPGTPRGAVVDPHGDHRIAIAFSVLGLRTPGMVIADPACVAKTCPTFFDLLSGLEQGTG